MTNFRINLEDLIGLEFSNLTVLGAYRTEDRRYIYCCCVCICGKYLEIRYDSLHNKKRPVKSCGCVGKEIQRKAVTRHGLVGTKIYNVTQSIKRRCYNKNAHEYKDYGGRGILACQGVIEPEILLKVLGEPPSKDYSIDRIDNNGNYFCGICKQCLESGWILNCRWASRIEQENNKRTNRYITLYGKTQTVANWARELNKDIKIIRNRLRNKTFSIEKVFDLE